MWTLRTSTGEIQVHRVDGFVKAVTSTGKISVDEVWEMLTQTSTGEIQIHKVDGFIKAVTSNGKINVDEVSGMLTQNIHRRNSNP